MELNRITLPPLSAPGEVMTFYASEGGARKGAALSNVAVLLSSRQEASVPVLMLDWDIHAPLDVRTGDAPPGGGGPPGGVHELFAACADVLAELGHPRAAPGDTRLAARVLGAVRWQDYLQRVDDASQLYLIGAGDPACHVDWDGLRHACPALYRVFAGQLCRYFSHVLVNARTGRSPESRICTSLLPGKLVALFTPAEGSLDALAAALREAADYRRSHEEVQGLWPLYPLPCGVDSSDAAHRRAWRHGDPRRGRRGYQAELEKMLRHCYGMRELSLGSYLDEVMLQHDAGEEGMPVHARGGDRLSLARSFEALLQWAEHGEPAWRSAGEVALLREVRAARADAGDEVADGIDAAGDGTAQLALALAQHRLGELYLREGREREALDCVQESARLRTLVLGDRHPDTLACSALLVRLLQRGAMPDALALAARLVEDCSVAFGPDDARTLAARLEMATALSLRGEHDAALRHHDQLNVACEQALGRTHPLAISCFAGQAQALARKGELSRARMVCEHVLEARQRLLGSAHPDTLDAMRELARVLVRSGDHAPARTLQESVLAACERQFGSDDARSITERVALAGIASHQGDAPAVHALEDALPYFDGQPHDPSQQERLGGRYRHAAPPPQRERGSAAALAASGAPRVAPLGGYAAPHFGSLDTDIARLRALLRQEAIPAARDLAGQIRRALREGMVPGELRAQAATLVRQVYHMQGNRAELDAFQKDDLEAYDARDGLHGEAVPD